MGEERPPIKDKYPLYRGARDDRSNLELRHNRHTAQAVTYSQIALAILVLGATIVAFSYLILKDFGVGIWIRVGVCLPVFTFFALLAGRRAYLSWEHFLTAQFIEEVFGGPHTWEKYKRGDRLKQFRKYTYDEKLKKSRKRRYCLFLDKIFKHKISKYIP